MSQDSGQLGLVQVTLPKIHYREGDSTGRGSGSSTPHTKDPMDRVDAEEWDLGRSSSRERVRSLGRELQGLEHSEGCSHILLADLRTQLLLDDRRTHYIGRRLSHLLWRNLLRRNLLLGRRDSTTPTTTTNHILGRRIIISHVE